MLIRWARSATKHRISRECSRYVVETAGVIFAQDAPEDSPLRDERMVFLGPDEDGVLLEVMAVETRLPMRRRGRPITGLLIIHAMPIRDQYRNQLKGTNDA